MSFVRRHPLLTILAGIFFGLLLIYLLVVDSLIKQAVTSQLEQATGAEVNIEGISHRLFPLGVQIEQIQLTDPAQPAQNRLQVALADADVEFWPLLKGKVIVPTLRIDQLAFSQPRQKPGAVYRQPEPNAGLAQLKELLTLPDIASVDELLADSPLKTTAAIQQVQGTFQRYDETLKQQYEALPDKQKLEEYKAKVDALKEVDMRNPAEVIKAQQTLKTLKDELQRDKQVVSGFAQTAKQATEELDINLAALKAAPAEDYQQLKGLIAGDPDAIATFTQALFGRHAAEYSRHLLTAWQLISPMLGQDSQVKPEQPTAKDSGLPDFWIKQASISLKLADEFVVSEWQDITAQHDLIGEPTRFHVDAAAGQWWQQLNMAGQVAVRGGALFGEQSWQMAGVKLAGLTLANSEYFSGMLESASLLTSGTLSVQDNQLDGTGSFDLSDMQIKAEGNSSVARTLAAALDSMNTLSLTTLLSGTATAPEFGFRSNAAQQLASLSLATLNTDEQGKLVELETKLNAMITDQLGESEQQYKQWLDMQAIAQGELGTIDDMLQTSLDDLVEQQKNKLLNKLLDKIDNG